MAKPDLTRLPVGTRVTIRRRIPEGFSDVVGEILAADPTGVRVRDRHGHEVWVPAEIIAIARVVGPHRRGGQPQV